MLDCSEEIDAIWELWVALSWLLAGSWRGRTCVGGSSFRVFPTAEENQALIERCRAFARFILLKIKEISNECEDRRMNVVLGLEITLNANRSATPFLRRKTLGMVRSFSGSHVIARRPL
jgi:hypothetical protein